MNPNADFYADFWFISIDLIRFGHRLFRFFDRDRSEIKIDMREIALNRSLNLEYDGRHWEWELPVISAINSYRTITYIF